MTQSQLPEFTNTARSRLATCLLLLRIGIFIVFFMWTIDKFINPEHAGDVFKKFYKVEWLNATLSYAFGAAQMLVIIAFLVGFLRTWSYGLVLLMHAVSTLSSWQQYLDPWNNHHLLFYAAIPMLAGCLTVWLMRDFDTISLDACLRNKSTGQSPQAAKG